MCSVNWVSGISPSLRSRGRSDGARTGGSVPGKSALIAARPPGFWQHRGLTALSLAPLSWLYGIAVWLRRELLGMRRFRSPAPEVPVIVVGNMTVGGTGKTPLVLWLTQMFKRHGLRAGIVSRGYGVTLGADARLVTADGDVADNGDEPLLLAQRCGCPVAIHPNRRKAVQRLLRVVPRVDIVIADDGLQHYALHRDIEIALIDGDRRFGNGMLLPAGPLREPPGRLAGIDFLVCRGGPARGREFTLSLSLGDAVNIRDPHRQRMLSRFRGQPVVAMCGIGNPRNFFDMLRAAGLVFQERAFEDHHRFTPEDFPVDSNTAVLMTGKDAVKCTAWAGANCWSVPLQSALPPAFETAVLGLLRERVAARDLRIDWGND